MVSTLVFADKFFAEGGVKAVNEVIAVNNTAMFNLVIFFEIN